MNKFDCRHLYKSIWALKNVWLVILAFLVPMFLLFEDTHKKEFRCAYVLIVMAILWMTEAMPIPVTSLLPVILLPMFGIQSAKTVAGNYMSDTNMLYFGGLIVAVAMEEVHLHKRIALKAIRLLGSRVNTLILGLMIPTWFLSMWINNTAATAMMVSIIVGVTEQVVKVEDAQLDQEGHEYDENDEQTAKASDINSVEKQEKDIRRDYDERMQRHGKAFSLCITYAASCGGIATLTGTPCNLILQGQADLQFLKSSNGTKDAGVTFANWMAFGVPLSVLMLIACWIWLQIFFLRKEICENDSEQKRKAVQQAIENEWNKLGSIRFAEVVVMISFSTLVILWIFRDIPNVGGWGSVFTDMETRFTTIKDSTVAISISIVLFILPKEVPNVFCFGQLNDKDLKNEPEYKPVLTWQIIEKKMSWGVIFLVGGGFALAAACTDSGLSRYIGCSLGVFSDMQPWLMNLALCCVISGVTEVSSNTATSTLIMPIMAELALSVGKNPLYLMITSAISCSFAYMLPVATPPNAIVFSTGYLKIKDMVIAGFVMKVISILLLTLAINTWGSAIFELETFPSIFHGQLTQTKCESFILQSRDNDTLSGIM